MVKEKHVLTQVRFGRKQQHTKPKYFKFNATTHSGLFCVSSSPPSVSQAWTNMVLTLLDHVLLLSNPSFRALQPALYPCLSQLSCHVTDTRVRQALREWLDRVGRLYDIIAERCPESVK